AVDQVRRYSRRFGCGEQVFGHLVPGDVEVNVVEVGARQDRLDGPDVVDDRTHDAAETQVRPDDRGAWMSSEEGLQLLQVDRDAAALRKGPVDVVVQENDQPGLGGEV